MKDVEKTIHAGMQDVSAHGLISLVQSATWSESQVLVRVPPAGKIQPLFKGGPVMERGSKDETNTPSLLDVLGSVVAAMFGVQSNRNREKDFTHGKPSQYIIIGLLATVVFVLVIWGVVSLVMKLAGV